MEGGSPVPPIYFVHSMPAGIKWPLKGSVVAFGDSAPKGGLAGCHDEAMGGDALRPFPFKLPPGNPNLYRASMSLRVRCAPSVCTPSPLAEALTSGQGSPLCGVCKIE